MWVLKYNHFHLLGPKLGWQFNDDPTMLVGLNNLFNSLHDIVALVAKQGNQLTAKKAGYLITGTARPNTTNHSNYASFVFKLASSASKKSSVFM